MRVTPPSCSRSWLPAWAGADDGAEDDVRQDLGRARGRRRADLHRPAPGARGDLAAGIRRPAPGGTHGSPAGQDLATADHNVPTDGTPAARMIADELSRIQVETL